MTICARCEEEPATKTWDRGADYAFWTREPRQVPVCDACWTYFDNYDPPDPDGECFRGGEAAAYAAEQQAAAWRLK